MPQIGTDCVHFGQYIRTDFGWRQQDGKITDQRNLQMFECAKHGPISLERCRNCPDHTRLRFPAWEWAVAITTTPGRDQYLVDTCLALETAWPANHRGPLLTFDDALALGPDKQTLGPFGNFYRAATEMYLRQPHATAYLFLQDDVILDPESRTIVEALGTDTGPWAVLSLYTAPELSHRVHEAPMRLIKDNGRWRQLDAGWASPGACAYVFSDWGLRDFLTDPVVLAHRRIGPGNGWRCLDSVVGVWAAKHGGIFHHVPPLAKHIGAVSTHDKGTQ